LRRSQKVVQRHKKSNFCINVYRLFTRALSDILFAVVAYAWLQYNWCKRKPLSTSCGRIMLCPTCFFASNIFDLHLSYFFWFPRYMKDCCYAYGVPGYTPIFSGVRFSFLPSFVCSSSIYEFWLPHWYLQTLLDLRNSIKTNWIKLRIRINKMLPF
jgi:hypothetical protein